MWYYLIVHMVNMIGGELVDGLDLKRVVLSKYGSISRFAQAMQWNRSKAERILNGKQAPSLEDIKKMAIEMELPDYLIVPIFFGTMFTASEHTA